MVTIKNKPAATVLSSSLSELVIQSDSVSVELSVTNEADGSYLYQEKLWTYSGIAVAYNLNEVIEIYMRDNGLSTLRVKISAQSLGQSDSVSVQVLYCENFDLSDSDISLFLENNFLTSLDSRRIAPGAKFSMHFFSGNPEREMYDIEFLFSVKDDPELKSLTYHGYSEKVADKIFSVSVDLENIRNFAASQNEVDASSVDVYSVNISCGSRYMALFVDKSLHSGESFLFRNIFNAIDWITIPALTTNKTEVERSVAALPGKSAFYDRSVTKSFEVQTGPVNFDEASLLEQLASAHEAFIYSPVGLKSGVMQYAVREILISESDISFSNADESKSVKFTWRFADNRPPVVLADPTRIFTSEYNKSFS